MLVAVHSFGNIWSSRHSNRKKHRDGCAYFNTTGVHVGDQFRHRSCCYGHVRIDECTGFTRDFAYRYIGRVFNSDPLQVLPNKRKLFLKSLMPSGTAPDIYLVTVGSHHVGTMKRTGAWVSQDVQVVSFSEGNGKQEALLLMPALAWVRGASGTFCIVPNPPEPWRSTLVKISDGAESAIREQQLLSNAATPRTTTDSVRQDDEVHGCDI